MTIIVSKDVESTINEAVQSGHFASADEMITKLVREYEDRMQLPTASEQEPAPAKRKPLWERAAELRQSIPAEEWDKLPTDGARQLDHYIYGSPKRTDA
jgi:Arc/MetJ-type ribon-helix-helix transcriptional regulator